MNSNIKTLSEQQAEVKTACAKMRSLLVAVPTPEIVEEMNAQLQIMVEFLGDDLLNTHTTPPLLVMFYMITLLLDRIVDTPDNRIITNIH